MTSALLLALACGSPAAPAPVPAVAPTAAPPAPPAAAPIPFMTRPLRVDVEMGPPYDHGSTTPERALMHTGKLVPGKRGHHAHDFPVPPGTEVFAVAAGRVIFAGDQGPAKCDGYKSDRNVWVKLVHDRASDGNEYITQYYHLSEVTVAEGERVEGGQLIGKSGNTGCSGSPHLHFSVARNTSPDGYKGVGVDPYGWSGSQPDPAGERGNPSHWLWKEGEAPPLVRRTSLQQTDGPPLTPLRMTMVDALDPIGGEWVEIGVRGRAKGKHNLAGYVLRNHAGDRFALPSRVLGPGDSVRVWTRKATLAEGELSWGLDHEAWDDDGDCVMLLDPTGKVSAAMGAGLESCRTVLGTKP